MAKEMSVFTHHRVFNEFERFRGPVPSGFQVSDFLGGLTRTSFFAGLVASRGLTLQTYDYVDAPYPEFDDDYFLWIDLLEAVMAAENELTIVELGAGYGEWLVRAYLAAYRRRPDLRINLIGVEAEPTHFEWMRQHFVDNGLDPAQHHLIEAAVDEKEGTVEFYVGDPDGWYGQEIVREATRMGNVATRQVRAVTLGHILKTRERVDLIHLDVQGAELAILRTGMDDLNSKVKRVQIGTHSRSIEQGLRDLFWRDGWFNLNDYASGSTEQTPWGEITFVDGVQTWVNPHLVKTSPELQPQRAFAISGHQADPLRKIMVTPNSPPRLQSVAIIVRVMDRADELRVSLPSFLHQEYPDYQVVIVDHCSQDGLAALLESTKSPRLRVVRCPRPTFFNPSSSGNIGVRYSFSDLLFFLDTGMTFRDERHLSEIVAAFESSSDIQYDHYKRWREETGVPSFERARLEAEGPRRRVYCECECHGLHTLVSRDIFQRIGGLNDALLDWGYEDTDLTARLELCGYGRIPIRELNESRHSDELRVRFFKVKSKERSWTKNRIISDGFIRTFGPILRTQRTPGLCEWVEIDGVRHDGTMAPQQNWTMETVGELLLSRSPRRNCIAESAPVVSVVVPTKNAAEYLVSVLDSILSQDYANVECLVVDGGSTDATLDILSSYGDRITLIRQFDRGAFDAINRGWRASRGQILAWLNADDSWAPGAISAAVEAFEADPTADVIYGDCLTVDSEGRELERRRPPDWDLAYAVETCHQMIEQPAVFIRRSIAERVGWLYPACFYDWDFWRRISLAGGKIKRIPHLLGCRRVRRENTQYRPAILIRGLVEVTRRFFALPGVPLEIQNLRHRALSNCYLKIVQTLQYGRPESRSLRFRLCLQAFAADPTNLRNVLKIAPAGHHPLPTTIPDETAVHGISRIVQDSGSSSTNSDAAPVSALLSVAGARKRPEPQTWVSVVVPCKNDARYLPEAIESILSQDYSHVECIVVDGGSTDGTIDLLERYSDRIRWLSEPDRGAFDAINRGWKFSKGEILAWLNADDLWAPGAVRTAVEVFEQKPEVDVVFGTAGLIDERGQLLFDLVPAAWDLEHALRHCLHIIYQPASFMRRRILEKVGWLYPAWCHDHDLWLRIARAGGTFEKIPTRLGMDRMRPETLGRVAELVIPAKIGLTKRFFADRGLPPNLQRLRGRAMSSAYIHGVEYLEVSKPRHWLTAFRLLVQATLADPLNFRVIKERATRPFRYHIPRLRSRISEPGMLVGVPRRWLGRVVQRIFVRGNRDLTVKVDSLQQAVAAAEHANSVVLDAVASRLDRIAAKALRLTDDLESSRREQKVQIAAVQAGISHVLERVEDRTAAVERAIAEALQPMAVRLDALRKDLDAVQARPPKLSDAVSQVYGTPPTLRPIPRWHTYWGIENGSNGLLRDRLNLWSSLRKPVLMRWLGDLLVMIWPGNELSRVLFLTGNFEPNELTWMSQTLTDGMVVIDVGAHMGMYTLTASKLVGESGVIVALEPSTREFQRLTFHVTLNDLRNVRCLQIAASSTSGEAMLKIGSEWNSGHNTFGEFFDESVEMLREERVPTQTVDALVAGQGLERVDLIKIDVEGHEYQVLAGAVQTIMRFRPRILIEVFEETLRRQGACVEAVIGFLTAHGYMLNEFSDVDGELVPLASLPDNESRNLVALPCEPEQN